MEWYNLEGLNSPIFVTLMNQSIADKLRAIQEAQDAGVIQSTLRADQLLALVLAISNMWNGTMHNWRMEDNDRAYQMQRQTILDAVRKLVT